VGELTQRENDWQNRATAAAIAAARRLACADDPIRMATPIGRLSDVEWGWIVAAVIFAWIAKRAEQATAEGLDLEPTIREGAHGAWDAGAIATILPQLAETPGIDWSRPLAEWPRESVLEFLGAAQRLTREAIAARDRGPGVTRQSAVPFAV
jgi:hypothetical protein